MEEYPRAGLTVRTTSTLLAAFLLLLPGSVGAALPGLLCQDEACCCSSGPEDTLASQERLEAGCCCALDRPAPAPPPLPKEPRCAEGSPSLQPLLATARESEPVGVPCAPEAACPDGSTRERAPPPPHRVLHCVWRL